MPANNQPGDGRHLPLNVAVAVGDTFHAVDEEIIERLAVGTEGQVYTVGSEGVPEWADATGGSSTPRFVVNPSFEAITRYSTAGDGNGTVTIGTDGLVVASPTGGGSYEGIIVLKSDVLGSLETQAANPEIQFLGRINNVEDDDEWEGLVGWGAINDSSLGNAFGLHFKADSEVLTISGVISDGGSIEDADFVEIWQGDPSAAPWLNARITYADGVTTVALEGTVLDTIEKVIAPTSTAGNFNIWMKNNGTANNAELQTYQLTVSWDS